MAISINAKLCTSVHDVFIPAALAQSRQTLFTYDMSTRHHHWWVLGCSLLLAYRASEDAVKPQIIGQRNLYWELILLTPFSAFGVHDCNHLDNRW